MTDWRPKKTVGQMVEEAKLRIENLSVGEGRVDLFLERQRTGVGFNILGQTGDVEVVTVR